MMFSVVIPVYNVAPYLRECLDSLLAQTCTDWEAICVDDGSTDDSPEILREYQTKTARRGEPGERLRVIGQPNRGVSAARNEGVALANGEWVVFLDPDDVLHPQTLAAYARMIRACPDADGATIRPLHFPDGESPAWPSSGEFRFHAVDLSHEVPFAVFDTPVWACAYRRERLGDLRFAPLTVGEDQLYVLGFIERAQKMAVSDFVGYAYRLRRNSAYHARWTARKFKDGVIHLQSVARTFASSSKRYAEAAWRKTALQLTGYQADDYGRLSADDRDSTWDVWMDALREVGGMSGMPWRSRMIMRMIGCTESRLLIRLLQILQWLKLHGVNRRLAVHRETDDA